MPNLPKTQRRPWLTVPVPFDRKRQGEFDYGSSAWKKLRTAFKRANPLCQMCQDKGIVMQGNTVDHITPINQGGDPYAWSNLQTLCTSCHNSKCGKERQKQ